MKVNIGLWDRTMRIVLGATILAAGYVYQSWWGLIGLLLVLTGLVGWCGLYTLLGISTKKNN